MAFSDIIPAMKEKFTVATREVDKYEMLMIRACKQNTVRMSRLRRIAAIRNGVDKKYISNYNVVDILGTIVKDFKLCDLNMFILKILNIDTCIEVAGLKDGRMKDSVRACASLIAMARIDLFPGYISPLKFRTMEKS